MNKTPNYPCHLFHKTKEECQLVKSAEDHKKLHQWNQWVMEDETHYYKKPEIKIEEPKIEEIVEEVKSPVKSKGKAK